MFGEGGFPNLQCSLINTRFIGQAGENGRRPPFHFHWIKFSHSVTKPTKPSTLKEQGSTSGRSPPVGIRCYFCPPILFLRWPCISHLRFHFLDLRKTNIQETFSKYLLIDSFNPQVCNSWVAQFNYSTWQSSLSGLIDLLPGELNIGFTAHMWKCHL